ncbi:MAG TPA: hypothetical protein VFN21_01690 [Acidimicrobiales bacterium]|nr:hypothetical protein [Acidimicrobiales bacterium]
MTITRRRRSRWLVAAVVGALVVSGCSGSSGGEADQPTTSFKYLVDPLEPGAGFIQLGPNRYPFDGVICATGPVESDPEGSTRIFGVYANFRVDGTLAAVALTRYHNEVIGKTRSIPTLTETALIQMQGDQEVRGLSAKRFRVVGEKKWQDPNDPAATTALITHEGDRYDAKGTFAPVNVDVATSTTVTGSTGAGAGVGDDTILGEVAARCPAKSAGTSTTSAAGPATTGGAATTVVAPPPAPVPTAAE